MATLLPIRPEDGFPQTFELDLGGPLYRFVFSVSFLSLDIFRPTSPEPLSVPLDAAGTRTPLPWPAVDPADSIRYSLPQEGLYLVMRVERDGVLLGITRPTPGMPIRMAELTLRFIGMEIARGNLIGPGSFGSQIVAEVSTLG